MFLVQDKQTHGGSSPQTCSTILVPRVARLSRFPSHGRHLQADDSFLTLYPHRVIPGALYGCDGALEREVISLCPGYITEAHWHRILGQSEASVLRLPNRPRPVLPAQRIRGHRTCYTCRLIPSRTLRIWGPKVRDTQPKALCTISRQAELGGCLHIVSANRSLSDAVTVRGLSDSAGCPCKLVVH